MSWYTTQDDDYSCAPIAISNALKWAGKHQGHTLDQFQWFCNTNSWIGTPLDDMEKAIDFLHLSDYGMIKKPMLKTIDYHLDEGRALIGEYRHRTGTGGHSFLIVGRTPYFYKVVNFNVKDGRERRISRKTLSRAMQFRQPSSNRAGTIWPVDKNED